MEMHANVFYPAKPLAPVLGPATAADMRLRLVALARDATRCAIEAGHDEARRAAWDRVAMEALDLASLLPPAPRAPGHLGEACANG